MCYCLRRRNEQVATVSWCGYTKRRVEFSSYNEYKLNSHLTCFRRGFIAQSVEHRTGITEVMGSNPVGASEFFLGFICNCSSYFITAKISFTCKNDLADVSNVRPSSEQRAKWKSKKRKKESERKWKIILGALRDHPCQHTFMRGPSITFSGRGYFSKHCLASSVSSTTYLSIPWNSIERVRVCERSSIKDTL